MLLIHDGAESCQSTIQLDIACDETMLWIHGTSPKYWIVGLHLYWPDVLSAVYFDSRVQ